MKRLMCALFLMVIGMITPVSADEQILTITFSGEPIHLILTDARDVSLICEVYGRFQVGNRDQLCIPDEIIPILQVKTIMIDPIPVVSPDNIPVFDGPQPMVILNVPAYRTVFARVRHEQSADDTFFFVGSFSDTPLPVKDVLEVTFFTRGPINDFTYVLNYHGGFDVELPHDNHRSLIVCRAFCSAMWISQEGGYWFADWYISAGGNINILTVPSGIVYGRISRTRCLTVELLDIVVDSQMYPDLNIVAYESIALDNFGMHEAIRDIDPREYLDCVG